MLYVSGRRSKMKSIMHQYRTGRHDQQKAKGKKRKADEMMKSTGDDGEDDKEVSINYAVIVLHSFLIIYIHLLSI